MASRPPSSWLVLVLCLLGCFGLSFGLTFRSDRYCYAGTCGSHLFPLQARLHVVAWYCFLIISFVCLIIRSRSPSLRRFLQRPVCQYRVPVIKKHLVVGAALAMLWIAALYVFVAAIWWWKLDNYFTTRGVEGGVTTGNVRLAAVAFTGHLCDITMGMAIIPVSRHSAIASRLSLSVATTLTFHMFAAYTLFILVIVHGAFYVSWVPVYNSLNETLRMVYPVLNPTYTYSETWPGLRDSLGIWRASLIFSGSVVGLIMLLIAITTLPPIRKAHFNLFYFTHLLGGVAIVIICLHASTMFYCLSPGLILYVYDWLSRLRELRQPLPSRVDHLGKGWYGLTVAFPRRRIRGYAKTSPLAHFYLHHADSSLRELHPFCSATSLVDEDNATDPTNPEIRVQFLFRTRGQNSGPAPVKGSPDIAESGLRPLWGHRRRARPEWTNRLAGFAVDETPTPMATTTSSAASSETEIQEIRGLEASAPPPPSVLGIKLRLEGPYFSIAQPANFDTVICIVAGTGVSGALAIAGAFRALDRRSRPSPGSVNSFPGSASSSLTLDEKTTALPSKTTSLPSKASDASLSHSAANTAASIRPEGPVWRHCIVVWTVREEHYIDLPELTGPPVPGFQLQLHLTGKGKPRLDVPAMLRDTLVPGQSSWIYISGPNAFIGAGEEACRLRNDPHLECTGARWDI